MTAAAPFPVDLLNQDADRLSLRDACVDTVVVTWSLCSIANTPGRVRRSGFSAETRRCGDFHRTRALSRRRRQEVAKSADAGLAPMRGRLSFRSQDGRSFARRGVHDREPEDRLSGGSTCAHLHVQRQGEEELKRKTKNEKRKTKNEKQRRRTVKRRKNAEYLSGERRACGRDCSDLWAVL